MLPPGESQQPPPPPPPPAERAVDLLRDLPTELLDKILAGLPARDVVRTSVLSPPWERRWESVAGLDIQLHGVSDDTGARGSVANNFINRFLAGVPVHDDNSGAWWGSAARFLENCAGPVGRVSIRGVPLSVYLRADDWVRAVAGKSPRSLSLALPLPTPLPSLFDCNPARLSELELRCCSIAAPPAGFAGFQRLSKLDLDDVVFTGGNAWAQLEAMISAAAPTLVELRLQNIAFFPNADFGFVVPGGWVIQAPRLRRLVLCLRIRRAGLWELGPLPNLELARIFLNDSAENRDYVKMFTAISNVRDLHIGNFRIRRQVLFESASLLHTHRLK
ncbi:hypothetical protein BDA96_02G106300 [Sorghum bicolor]|uniref:F-box domain-containing protein n=2 Tax=Sorghum bicolor TaxID=4558 RepID=A0A921RLJ9_SORBI|nr:hypothetical protein BDA96_02G106300 [Sorghum bicolor]